MPRNADAKRVAIFAAMAALADLDVSGLDALRADGWDITHSLPGAEGPEREIVNQFFREVSAALVDIAQYGILPWDSDQQYAHPARVTSEVDGNVYRTVRNNRGVNPATDTNQADWELDSVRIATSAEVREGTPPTRVVTAGNQQTPISTIDSQRGYVLRRRRNNDGYELVPFLAYGTAEAPATGIPGTIYAQY